MTDAPIVLGVPLLFLEDVRFVWVFAQALGGDF
jgi:hypothetical protein